MCSLTRRSRGGCHSQSRRSSEENSQKSAPQCVHHTGPLQTGLFQNEWVIHGCACTCILWIYPYTHTHTHTHTLRATHKHTHTHTHIPCGPPWPCQAWRGWTSAHTQKKMCTVSKKKKHVLNTHTHTHTHTIVRLCVCVFSSSSSAWPPTPGLTDMRGFVARTCTYYIIIDIYSAWPISWGGWCQIHVHTIL